MARKTRSFSINIILPSQSSSPDYYKICSSSPASSIDMSTGNSPTYAEQLKDLLTWRGVKQRQTPDFRRQHVLSMLEPYNPRRIFSHLTLKYYLRGHPDFFEISFDDDWGSSTISRSAIIQPLLIAQMIDRCSPISQCFVKMGCLGEHLVYWDQRVTSAPELDLSIEFKLPTLPKNLKIPRKYPFFFIRSVETNLDSELAPLANLYHSSEALQNLFHCMAWARRRKTFFHKIRVFSCVLWPAEFEILMHRAIPFGADEGEEVEGVGKDAMSQRDSMDDVDDTNDMEIDEEAHEGWKDKNKEGEEHQYDENESVGKCEEVGGMENERDALDLEDWVDENDQGEDDEEDEGEEYHEDDEDDEDEDSENDDDRDKVQQKIEFRFVSLGRYPANELYLRVGDILNQIAADELYPRLYAALTTISAEEKNLSSLKRKFLKAARLDMI